jgi:hypothetical protein
MATIHKKIMKQLFFFILILTLFSIYSPVFACQPCASTLNLEQSIAKSDLIIVGQKIADGPGFCKDCIAGGSDWIEVKIIETLKGSTPSTKIKINSWDGMCAYGIIINDNRNYLMLLQKRDSGGESFYDAVNFGCAEKSYLVENNQIDLNGQKISLENFISKYGLIKTTINNQTQTKDSTNNQQNLQTDTIKKDGSNDKVIQNQDLNNKTVKVNNFKPYYYIIPTFLIFVILIYVLLKIVRKK